MLNFFSRPSVRVLVVCTANICRSPAAEQVLAALAKQEGLHRKIKFDSAGVGHVIKGHPPDPRMVNLLKNDGFPVRRTRAKPVTEKLLAESNYVWVMDEGHVSALQDRYADFAEKCELFDPESQSIEDPYFGSRQDVGIVFERIKFVAAQRLAQLELGLSS